MDGRAFAPLVRFQAYARQPATRQDVAEGALLVAEIAYPQVRHDRYLRRLGLLARLVREELGLPPGGLLPTETLGLRATAERVLEALAQVLARHEGLTGEASKERYDPRNSFLNEVLDRGAGVPITLCVVYLAVGRALGAPLVGVGLPEHFMVAWPLPEQDDTLYLDAFHGGRVRGTAACRRFMRGLLGERYSGWDARWATPLDTPGVLTRMLQDLKASYLLHGETLKALETVERLVVLRPDLPEELRDRGLLRLALGEPLLAAADIAAYAERAPAAPELGRLRRRFADLREVHAKLN